MDSWNKYFLSIAYFAAMRSKDESTKFGAVIATKDHSAISTGYNSFPRGLNDDIPSRQERPDKYFYFEHAERNSIYNAARIGVPTKDCILYTQGIPCADCGRAIIQAGITTLVVHDDWEIMAKSIFGDWDKSRQASLDMLNECGVDIIRAEGSVSYENSHVQVSTFIRGQWFRI